MRLNALLASLTCLLMAVAQSGCGAKLLSMNEEVALGEQAAPELTQQYGGAVPDERLHDSLVRVGRSMTDTLEPEFKDLPWEFTLLNSPVINAFALPGGKVFVSRALIERMTNEAQLAGVVGHEIGHVRARHGNQKISAGLIAQGVVIGAAIAVSGNDSDLVKAGVPMLVQAGSGSFLLKYGRDQELEADKYGIDFMTRVGYNPIAMRQVMEILEEASGGNSPPEFFSTHPHPESRIKQIDGLLQGQYAYTQFNTEYQVYESRFNDEFLRPLSRIPEPAQAMAPTPFDTWLTASWCATCAEMEEAGGLFVVGG